jgi:hypothetical protein
MRTLTATRRSSRVDICHVSLTTDMISTYIWPHRREVNPVAGEVYYRMEPMESAQLKDVMATRKILHSYIDHAMGEQLRQTLQFDMPMTPRALVVEGRTRFRPRSASESRLTACINVLALTRFGINYIARVLSTLTRTKTQTSTEHWNFKSGTDGAVMTTS